LLTYNFSANIRVWQPYGLTFHTQIKRPNKKIL
jgi:hypothetical protein